jgi:hypothetical protein
MTMSMSKDNLAAGIIACLIAAMVLVTQIGSLARSTASGVTVPSAVKTSITTRYRSAMPESAKQYYARLWGIDQMSVKLAESGQLVRFSYRVTDAAKAAPLHDRASIPVLYDEKMNAVLEVPVMEKVGPLRQSMPPQNGQSNWMVFSNKGGLVKAGHRVSVMIGSFRVDGLSVQ